MENTKYLFLLCAFAFLGCTTDSEQEEVVITTLANLVASSEVEIDNVIACASGSENEDEIIAYVYPRPGATDLRYFETANTAVDKNDYTEYVQIILPEEDFFNGYLKTFTRQTVEEKWVIISFRESGILHLSNPILLKHQTQNTQFTDQITIEEPDQAMPFFSWENLADDRNAIYFQVVSDASNELLSGTYTFQEQWQYYLLDNVVLNITLETPPQLLPETTYGFTLMGVSEDNWVNVLGQRSFNTQ